MKNVSFRRQDKANYTFPKRSLCGRIIRDDTTALCRACKP